MSSSIFPALIVLAPLVAALFCSGFSWLENRLCLPTALIGLSVSAVAALKLLLLVIQGGVVQYRMGGWAPPFGIEYRIDLFNALVLLLVVLIPLVNLVASHRSLLQGQKDRLGTFYAVYLLFVTGLAGVVSTGDLFNLYVLLEITSLTSYALIAMGDPDRGPLASLNYVFIGVIGASFYLLGVGYLYIMTGSLNMVDVAGLIEPLYSSSAVLVAFVFCLLGVWIKMALFPLHVWLPNAYTYAPVAAARVIAPLMTKVMVYVMIRLMLSVFGLDYVFERLEIGEAVVWLSSLAMLAGAVMALAQRDLRKMLAYIIVCEIGFMVGGAWLGNDLGFSGAVLHIINDGLMTFALFLVLGNLMFRLKRVEFKDLQGVFARMPWTMAGFVLAGLSIIGVPPTCGFFSKWYLLLGGIEAGAYFFVAALLVSSLICAVLFFRVFEIGFFEPETDGHRDFSRAVTQQEAPVSMLIPLGLTTVSLVVLGLYSGFIVETIILPFLSR